MKVVLLTIFLAVCMCSCAPAELGSKEPPHLCWVSPPENAELYEQWLESYKRAGCERWEKR